jgi:hypothetical protein
MNSGKVYNILKNNLNNNLIRIIQNYNLNYKDVKFNKYIINYHLKRISNSPFIYNIKEYMKDMKIYNSHYMNYFNKNKKFHTHRFLYEQQFAIKYLLF